MLKKIASWWRQKFVLPPEFLMVTHRNLAPDHSESLRDRAYGEMLHGISEIDEFLFRVRMEDRSPFTFKFSVEDRIIGGVVEDDKFLLVAKLFGVAGYGKTGHEKMRLPSLTCTTFPEDFAIQTKMTIPSRISKRKLVLAVRSAALSLLDHEFDEWLLIEGERQLDPHRALELEDGRRRL